MTSDEPGTNAGTGMLGREQDPFDRDLSDANYSIYECDTCENVVFTLASGSDLTCHGAEMTEITECEIDVNEPDLRQVLLDAFDLPKAGLDICLCVIGDGPMSPGEVADTLDYDRSTISRYLNDLVDIGLLERSQLNRESGGVVNVYHSIDIDRMRRETLVGFFVWAGEAASLIEEANVTKETYLEEDGPGSLNEVFWEEFRN
ncbi:MAG: helix-turn-helix domain-containing protein [Halobacteriales archaeon]